MTHNKLTAKEVLEKIDQLSVWGQLIGVSTLRQKFISPYRADNNPGVQLVLRRGKVIFFDPAGGMVLDCIDGYKKKHPEKDIQECLREVLRMGLMPGFKGTVETTAAQIKSGKLKEVKWMESYNIVPFTEEGLLFWAMRGVTQEDLEAEETRVYQIEGYKVENKEEGKSFYRECFGFIYQIGEGFKRYCPGKDGYNKFGGSVSRDNFWHVKRGSKELLIAKSNKDLLVWKKFSKCDLVAFGSESAHPTDAKLRQLIQGYEKVTIVSDPDKAGIKGSNSLKKRILNFNPTLPTFIWNWPDPETKDLDGYRTINDHEKTLKFIKKELAKLRNDS